MWNPGTIQTLLDAAQYHLGRVGMIPIRAVINAAVENQPSHEQGNPEKSETTAALNDTAQVLRSSPGRLYHIRVTNTSAAAVNIVLTDGGDTIVVGGCVVPAVIDAVGNIAAIPGVAEVAFFASPQGAGQAILTTLRARAFTASDGTTGAAAGVTVTALTSA